jgi:DNA-binding transcriptional ArsR family regulator
MVYNVGGLDGVFHALADPTRRAILRRLARGPARITELAEPFDTSLPAVSKHVKVLEAAGLVRRTIHGREHHCALAPKPLRGASQWISFYQRFWESRLEALDHLMTEQP